ncbi:MAG: Fur family transcriptional regulator [Pseudomonadota bacterium]|nr:Fur family transcriptional regulator [Pseudomonadota bacterium]
MLESRRRLEHRLRSCGIKPTSQRIEVGLMLLETPIHLSADQILSNLRAEGSHISKATIYNTLNLFINHGLAREVLVDSTRQFYDSSPQPHHHFYNVDTGELIDIQLDEIEINSLPELPHGTEAQDLELIIRVSNKRN